MKEENTKLFDLSVLKPLKSLVSLKMENIKNFLINFSELPKTLKNLELSFHYPDVYRESFKDEISNYENKND